jgi:hypothetical protein
MFQDLFLNVRQLFARPSTPVGLPSVDDRVGCSHELPFETVLEPGEKTIYCDNRDTFVIELS